MTSATRLTEVEEDDLLVQLRNLKQVSHIRSYIKAFEELNSKAGIEEDQALSIFLSGLLDEIRVPVCMFKPRTLDEAYALSKLQELTINVLWCDREKNLRRNEKLDVNSKVEGLKYEFDESSEFVDMIETDKEVSEGVSSGWDKGGDGPVDFGNSLNFFLHDVKAEKRLSHGKMKETELGPHVTDFSEYNTFSEENKLKEAECVPSVQQIATVRDIAITSNVVSNLMRRPVRFPKPSVKMKLVAQLDDELYEGFDDHSNGFFGRGEFSIFDARGHSGIQMVNEYTSDQRSDAQHDEVIGGKIGKQFNLDASMWQQRTIVHFGVDARAVERLDHATMDGFEYVQHIVAFSYYRTCSQAKEFKENELLANARRNAPSKELTAMVSVIRNLKGFSVRFPKPMVKMKLELFSLWELSRRKVVAHAWSLEQGLLVIELMTFNFSMLAIDHVNSAAKSNYMQHELNWSCCWSRHCYVAKIPEVALRYTDWVEIQPEQALWRGRQKLDYEEDSRRAEVAEIKPIADGVFHVSGRKRKNDHMNFLVYA